MLNIKRGIPSFYSPAQIRAYLQRVNFPDADANPMPSPNLTNLELLMRLHLLAFPYENSCLHYSKNHYMDVDPEAVFKRLVEDRKGGSWCFAQNGLFLGILRGLGYRVYAAPSRVNMALPNSEVEDWTGVIVHMVLIVQLDNEDSFANGTHSQSFMIDVGFGMSAPVRPIRLEVGHTVQGVGPLEEHRVIRVAHSSSLEEGESTLVWALQSRCGSYQKDWRNLFIFYEYEFYPAEWVQASQWLSRHPLDLFGKNVYVAQHFVVDSENRQKSGGGDEAQWGRLVMIGRTVQRIIGDQAVAVKEFSAEEERVHILRDDFGITIDEGDICNIFSTGAALPK